MKKLAKKEEKQELIVPAEFDTLFEPDGVSEVLTPYNVMNIYTLDTMNDEFSQIDVVARRHVLTHSFTERAEFLFFNCILNLNQALIENTKAIVKEYDIKDRYYNFDNEDNYCRDLIPINVHHYRRMPIFESCSIFDIISYFMGIINPRSRVDVSVVYRLDWLIEKLGFGVLNCFTDSFKTFQVQLISILGTLIYEAENVYYPGGLPEYKMDCSECNCIDHE